MGPESQRATSMQHCATYGWRLTAPKAVRGELGTDSICLEPPEPKANREGCGSLSGLPRAEKRQCISVDGDDCTRSGFRKSDGGTKGSSPSGSDRHHFADFLQKGRKK